MTTFNLGSDQDNKFAPQYVIDALHNNVDAAKVNRDFPRLTVGTGSKAVFLMISATEGYATSYGCSMTPGYSVNSLRGMVDLVNDDLLAELVDSFNKAKSTDFAKGFKPGIIDETFRINDNFNTSSNEDIDPENIDVIAAYNVDEAKKYEAA